MESSIVGCPADLSGRLSCAESQDHNMRFVRTLGWRRSEIVPVILVFFMTSAPVTAQVASKPDLTLSISPAAITSKGSHVGTISWTATNATSCAASGAWAGAKGVYEIGQDLAPTTVETSDTTYAYSLTCTGPGGVVQKSAPLTVLAHPVATASFNPSAVVAGANTTLTWSSIHAASCKLYVSPSDVRDIPTSGSMIMATPINSATFGVQVVCLNAAGDIGQDAAPQVMLTGGTTLPHGVVTCPLIRVGQGATCSWASAQADTCTMSLAQSGVTGTETATSCAGTFTLSPITKQSDPYGINLFFRNVARGYVDVQATFGGVNYFVPFVTGGVSVSPPVVAPGQSATIAWTTDYAASCTASGDWGGPRGTSGTQVVTLPNEGAYTFTLTCTPAYPDFSGVGTVQFSGGLVVNALLASGTRYVDPAGTDASNTCNDAANPCKTITHAMSQASGGTPGDTVQVAPGTYNMALGEVFPIVMTSGVRLISTAGAQRTIVDATGANRRAFNSSGGNSSTTIRGFTIKGGSDFGLTFSFSPGTGGALRLDSGDQSQVDRNIFVANEARGAPGVGFLYKAGTPGYGGAIYASGSPNITNNVFIGNIADGGTGADYPANPWLGGDGQGGAIYATGGGAGAKITNNTFYGNQAIGGSGGSGLTYVAGGTGGNGKAGAVFASNVDVNNNIFVANGAFAGAGGPGAPAGPAGTASYGALEFSTSAANVSTNNLFFGNSATGGVSGDNLGAGFINADPFFHAAPSDLHIRESSPASGAGNASVGTLQDLDGVVRASPPAIGAYEPTLIQTSTALASSLDPSNLGQTVTFTATVTSAAGTAAGNVVFSDGAAILCAGVPLSGGQAQCTTSALGAGAHSITARFAGNTDFAASTAASVAQVVQGPSNFALTVVKAGLGSGSITSSPAGIDCGATCIASYGSGTSVALTATPSATSSFSGWSGNGCTGTGACSITMRAQASVTATFTPNPPRLANISTRMQVLTGDNVMIGGFIIGGSTSKTVVVRARGPSLVPFGITNPLVNPMLQLVRSSDQSTIAANDDWQSAANAADVAASGFAPSNPLESAILMNLAPGAYTAIVSGVGGTTGVGLIEVFEVDHPEVPLINISTRGFVQTGNNVMIGGFIIQGAGPQTVVVRARGPSLVPFGIANPLANPSLQLVRSSDQATIAVNDDWQTAVNAAQLSMSGFAPSNALESAILITLDPGAYTAIVSGVAGGTGVAIVEVFAR